MVAPVDTVHPHARGERIALIISVRLERGSSPRTWGTPGNYINALRSARFIPTHVGNAQHAAPISPPRPVHPHARGERMSCSPRGHTPNGSSPRTWGTHGDAVPPDQVPRFIPTHVGNASWRATTPTNGSVHPHARGERHSDPPLPCWLSGSSPRTWGTRAVRAGDRLRRRFIPTHVGNATPITPRRRERTVHPHARGERRCMTLARLRFCGSSPRTWGTPPIFLRRTTEWRFIPTHVGNAAQGPAARWQMTVHPHARGERARCCWGRRPAAGSSPRTWGTPASQT